MIQKSLFLWIGISQILNYTSSQSIDVTCDLADIFLDQMRGGCSNCAQENCIECFDQNRCYKCKKGYYLSIVNNFYFYTLKYLTSNMIQQNNNYTCVSQCQKDGYFANKYDLFCQKCQDQNCLQCFNKDKCEKCIEGFFINNDKTKCIKQMCSNGGIYIKEKDKCSLECLAYQNSNLEFSCNEYRLYNETYYRVQQTLVQSQPLQSIRSISKYNITENEQIVNLFL